MVIKELEGDLARVVRRSPLYTDVKADEVTDLYLLHRVASFGYYRGRHDTSQFHQTAYAKKHALEATRARMELRWIRT
jgi:hypothetical protein